MLITFQNFGETTKKDKMSFRVEMGKVSLWISCRRCSSSIWSGNGVEEQISITRYRTEIETFYLHALGTTNHFLPLPRLLLPTNSPEWMTYINDSKHVLALDSEQDILSSYLFISVRMAPRNVLSTVSTERSPTLWTR